MASFFQLLYVLDHQRPLYIQTHDFPDHDALSSAYGLQQLLKYHGYSAVIIYSGSIIRGDLQDFMSILAIPAEQSSVCTTSKDDQLIIVDGCPGNRNIRDLGSTVVAVIDHHPMESGKLPNAPFVDIRPDYGSCSTIIASYYREAQVEMSKNVATAFLAGLYIDTSFLTRGVSKQDIELINQCYPIADREYMSIHVRNKIQSSDLPYFRYLLKHLIIADLCCFCFIPQGCEQNLMGILADFCLGIQEVRFVVLAARNDGSYSISARSEKTGWDAAEIVKALIEPTGFGGGHAHMAGGIIKNDPDFSPEKFRDQLYALIKTLPR